MKAKKVLAVAVVAACSLVAGTASADVLECQQKNGYAGGQVAGGPLEPAAVNTWATVRANSAYFTSNKRLTSNCTVKDVQSPKGKGAPAPQPDYVVKDTAGIAQDECSMLNSVGQIHTKLGNGKAGDAYLINLALMDKADSLFSTGKLSFDAKEAIKKAAADVDTCILELLP